MDWAIHVANILILCSFLVSNVTSLRVLSITAGVFFGLYFLTRAPPAYGPVCWNVLFGLVNSVKLIRIWRQRRKIPLSEDEIFLREHIFPKLFPVDIRSLSSQAHIQDLSSNALKIESNRLYFVLQGSIDLDNQNISKGSFLGIGNYLKPDQSSAVEVSSTDARCFSWTHTDIQNWTNKDKQRKNQLIFAFSQDLLNRSAQESAS